MIDKNNNFVIKSKLTITVKTLSEYNDRSRVAAKQTNKQTQTQKLTNIQAEKQKVILTQTHKQTYKRRHAQREKKQMKNEALCCCY